MNQVEHTAAREIGNVLRDARIGSGNTSRNAFAQQVKIRGKITGEGIRKIEEGERIPRLENIRLLGEACGLSKTKIKALEKKALEVNVKRVTKRAGNATVEVKIDGKPLRVVALPPHRKAELFTRTTVNSLIEVLAKLGVDNPKDIEYFTRHARSTILKNLSA